VRPARHLGDAHLDVELARQPIRAGAEGPAQPRPDVARRLPHGDLAAMALDLEPLLLEKAIDRRLHPGGVAGHEAARLDELRAEDAVEERRLLGGEHPGAGFGEGLAEGVLRHAELGGDLLEVVGGDRLERVLATALELRRTPEDELDLPPRELLGHALYVTYGQRKFTCQLVPQVRGR
jgi:hypothetical protein